MNEATLLYVRQHADDDVRQLALRGLRDPDVDLAAALQQIAGRQTARRKLPSWAAVDGILYPPHLSMEQCSSEQTARYKAEVVKRLLRKETEDSETPKHSATTLVDLTGGLGVDFSFLAPLFSRAVYVERQEELCRLARHNLNMLGIKAEVVCADGTDHLHQLTHATVIFIDPARRDQHGTRTYGISDCTPDVLQLHGELLQKSAYVVLKLSPMLDWRKTVNDLGEEWVSEVHIVSAGGECKELLIVLSKEQKTAGIQLFCINDDHSFKTEHGHLCHNNASSASGSLLFASPKAGSYLYEPNASIMKAGCFAELCRAFTVSQLAQNSHLFVSDHLIADFPGRRFQIQAITSMNKKELKEKMNSLRQANITVRNFPLSVAELRKRLKLADGGTDYIFATTLADNSHVLIICHSPVIE